MPDIRSEKQNECRCPCYPIRNTSLKYANLILSYTRNVSKTGINYASPAFSRVWLTAGLILFSKGYSDLQSVIVVDCFNTSTHTFNQQPGNG